MIKTNITEFYSKTEQTEDVKQSNIEPVVTVHPDISKVTGACINCAWYKYHASSYGDSEACKHVENVNYTYDHRGKHGHVIWQPEDKNKKLNCEYFEQKIPFMQKIKIKLGLA